MTKDMFINELDPACVHIVVVRYVKKVLSLGHYEIEIHFKKHQNIGDLLNESGNSSEREDVQLASLQIKRSTDDMTSFQSALQRSFKKIKFH